MDYNEYYSALRTELKNRNYVHMSHSEIESFIEDNELDEIGINTNDIKLDSDFIIENYSQPKKPLEKVPSSGVKAPKEDKIKSKNRLIWVSSLLLFIGFIVMMIVLRSIRVSGSLVQNGMTQNYAYRSALDNTVSAILLLSIFTLPHAGITLYLLFGDTDNVGDGTKALNFLGSFVIGILLLGVLIHAI